MLLNSLANHSTAADAFSKAASKGVVSTVRLHLIVTFGAGMVGIVPAAGLPSNPKNGRVTGRNGRVSCVLGQRRALKISRRGRKDRKVGNYRIIGIREKREEASQ